MATPNVPKTIGRYEIVDRIGHGGMGVVCRARDPRIGRLVAIKLLRVGDDSMRQRFLQEAQSAGSLQHRNIVTIYDSGEQDGESYIVMELVEGITLAEQIGTGVPLPLSRKLELIEDLARGLEYAHNRGIVHRDVKPSNVMISSDGVLKILDFGIARVGSSSLTRTGTMIGTPNYMSPEQVEGRVVDRRSDVFAVGLVFYELLTGRQAFPGATVRDVVDAIVKREPTPLTEVCPDLDPAFDAIIRRALHKDPARRYRTLSVLAADVARLRTRVAKTTGSADPPTVTIMSGESEVPVKARPSRLGAQPELEAKRRARIDEYLRGGQAAYDAGNFAAAIDACDHAGLLDPDEPRVRDLLERACTAIDKQQIAVWLADARSCVERDALEEASALLVRVAELAPDSGDAREVMNAIDQRRRWRQEEDARREAIADALTRARACLATGQFDVAIRAASEVLLQDPLHEEAHQLSQRAVADLQERRHQQRLAQTAQATIDVQKREFAAGRHLAAIESLQRATPHPLIDAAVSELRAELEAIERRARAEEERRRQEEEERRRQEEEARRRQEEQRRWVADRIAGARRLIAARQFVQAVHALQEVERVAPGENGVPGLIAEARAAQAAVEAAARREQQIADRLARMEAAIAAGHLLEARAIVDDILKLAPDHREARAKREHIAAAIRAAERQQALDREAEGVVRTARQRFDAGDYAGAVAVLESHAPPHRTTTAALAELKSTLADIERRREQEEADRRARVREAIVRAREAAGRAAFDEATTLLRPLSESDQTAAEALAEILAAAAAHDARLRREREAAERRMRAKREAAERRAEQERAAARLELERWARAQLADAGERLQRDDSRGAVQVLDDARTRLVDASASASLIREVAAALAAARKRLRVQTLLAEAQERVDNNAHTEALAKVDAALAIDPDAAAARELKTAIREAILTRARCDLEEFRRDRKAAEERYARERSEKIASALHRAGTTQSPRDAMLILAEALRLDPRNQNCIDLAAARQAELMVLVEALIDESRFADALHALEGLDEIVTTKDRLSALRDRAIIGHAVEVAERPKGAAEGPKRRS